MNEQQQKDFNKVANSMIEWINKNGHPHMTVIINSDSAEAVEGVICYSTKAHVKG